MIRDRSDGTVSANELLYEPGHAVDDPGRRHGTLSPRQQSRAFELMASRLDGAISVAELATECNLSPSRFAYAFKRTTGVSPHRWLTLRRIDRAKDLLRNTTTPLTHIALSCGFADQSHFTHVFSAETKVSPRRWRDGAVGASSSAVPLKA